MLRKFFAVCLLFVLIVGCAKSPDENNSQATRENLATDQPAAQQPALPPPAAPTAASMAESKPDAAARNLPPKKTTHVAAEPKPDKEIEMEKAGVGSGVKGRGLGQGFIATPISAYFVMKERIVFDIKIPDAMRAYKFEHNFKAPMTNEEFMKEVIQKNRIHLPELPPGHYYLYDPKTEKLMVAKPR
ncbi:MAG: hypothetical protein ACWGMZ_06265 [Thermoguttaceae bacterium]